MNQEETELINECKEAVRDLVGVDEYRWGFLLSIIKHAKHEQDDHLIEGMAEAVEQMSYLQRIEGHIGSGLIMLLQEGREELEREEREGHDCGQFYIDQADFTIRFGSILRSFEPEQWTPEVKELFEKGLDFLAKLLAWSCLYRRH